MNVLIYGFGRMGITHFSILKGLYPQAKFTVVEPNNVLRAILKLNIDAAFEKDDRSLTEPYDISLVTTPPFLHKTILNKCLSRGDTKIFIEKPFGGYANSSDDSLCNVEGVYIGYVLRFNPCIQWVKRHLSQGDIVSMEATYQSNTLSSKPVGWRNGPYSGVLNEVGSHMLDLIQYISGEYSYDISFVKNESKISDIDDIIEAELLAKRGFNVKLHFNWVAKGVRKPRFELAINMTNGDSYLVDQQQVRHVRADGVKSDLVSGAGLAESVPFYLRGVDFTRQMEDLVGSGDVMACLRDGLMVNKLMEKIIRHENHIG